MVPDVPHEDLPTARPDSLSAPPLQTGYVGSRRAFAVRVLLAVALSYCALKVLTNLVIVVARSGGDAVELNGQKVDAAPVAFSFFYAGLIDVILWVAVPRAWRWALAVRPRPFRPVLDSDVDSGPRPHGSLTGEIEPPTRW